MIKGIGWDRKVPAVTHEGRVRHRGIEVFQHLILGVRVTSEISVRFRKILSQQDHGVIRRPAICLRPSGSAWSVRNEFSHLKIAEALIRVTSPSQNFVL